MQRAIQHLCRLQVSTERFLEDHPGAFVTAAGPKALYDCLERRWWNGEVIQRMRRVAERRAELLKRRWVVVVAVHELEQRRQFGEAVGIDAAMCLEARAGARAEI